MEEFGAREISKLVIYCDAGHWLCQDCAAGSIRAALSGSSARSLQCGWEPPASAAGVGRCTARVSFDAVVTLSTVHRKLSAASLERFQRHEILEAMPEHLRVHCPRPGCGRGTSACNAKPLSTPVCSPVRRYSE